MRARFARHLVLTLALLTTAGMLSGCIVEPAPYYHHPHGYWYYR